MKWDELADKDKIKLILEHVYGYYVVEDEHFVSRNRGKLPADFHWPIAWWDETLENWGTRDISSNWNTAFDSLHDMNDAWQIVEKLYEQFNVRVFAESGMLSKYNVMVFDKDYGICQAHGYSDISMPDAICKAALKAVKVKIQ